MKCSVCGRDIYRVYYQVHTGKRKGQNICPYCMAARKATTSFSRHEKTNRNLTKQKKEILERIFGCKCYENGEECEEKTYLLWELVTHYRTYQLWHDRIKDYYALFHGDDVEECRRYDGGTLMSKDRSIAALLCEGGGLYHRKCKL